MINYKMVNGDLVPLSAQEVLEFEAQQGMVPQPSPEELGTATINALTLAYDNLSNVSPTLVLDFITLGTNVVQSIRNAVLIAQLKGTQPDFSLAKALIQGASNPNITEEQANEIKSLLISLIP